ncbi:hypothetical protein CWI84_08700 [Idiomarina tyrosinivorans]|uniref:Secondary thiamine-phosphate synthase n=1 Tax=Idiomarina tyrosinivorans TaxID=1445662 RepID=A0A432ZQ55_9GAMM|nr:secondary thiamine-phosphate synthase enzyme YjbQ [Idiomarina tyrosinivorans]RUO80027.1 hypothetical protein CWI84_08700 [Idiomarina tyrosinivorans]
MVSRFWQQKTLQLKPRPRGFHLVTEEIVSQLPEIGDYQIGFLQLFLQHTSASLTINENADADVRGDFERHFNRAVVDGAEYFQHTCEGPDDMPAHIKSSLLGVQLTLPISNGRLNLGTWQGIYLGEHRDHAGARRIIATIHGE